MLENLLLFNRSLDLGEVLGVDPGGTENKQHEAEVDQNKGHLVELVVLTSLLINQVAAPLGRERHKHNARGSEDARPPLLYVEEVEVRQAIASAESSLKVDQACPFSDRHVWPRVLQIEAAHCVSNDEQKARFSNKREEAFGFEREHDGHSAEQSAY